MKDGALDRDQKRGLRLRTVAFRSKVSHRTRDDIKEACSAEKSSSSRKIALDIKLNRGRPTKDAGSRRT
jgi:hypothetical protein